MRGDPTPRNTGARNFVNDSVDVVNDSVDVFAEPPGEEEAEQGADVHGSMELIDESDDNLSETPERGASSNSSGSFHTPGDSDRGSPERAAIKKRESPTPDMKASVKKRRRSVAWTPGGLGRRGRPVSPNASGDEDLDMQGIVSEGLVFSPSAHKPLVCTERRVSTSSSGDYPMDYQDFTDEVKARSNSTSLFDSHLGGKGRRPKPPTLDTLEGSDEDDTEPDNEDSSPFKQKLVSHNESSDQRVGRSPLVRHSPLANRGTPRNTPLGSRDLNSTTDSPIHVVRSKRQAAIVSSDEESFQEDNDSRTPAHQSVQNEESIEEEGMYICWT